MNRPVFDAPRTTTGDVLTVDPTRPLRRPLDSSPRRLNARATGSPDLVPHQPVVGCGVGADTMAIDTMAIDNTPTGTELTLRTLRPTPLSPHRAVAGTTVRTSPPPAPSEPARQPRKHQPRPTRRPHHPTSSNKHRMATRPQRPEAKYPLIPSGPAVGLSDELCKRS